MKVLAVVFAVCVALSFAERPPWNPFCQPPPSFRFCAVLPGQGVPLPKPVPSSDKVDVWVLQAPIWKFIPGLGNITEKAHLIHTAIGLVNTNSGKQYLYEFEGIYESPNATFPYIVEDSKTPGGVKLEWCNAGAVCWGEGIDWNYFSTTQKRVGTISGDMFNKLITWLPVENSTSSITYETFAVWNKWDNGNGKQYLESYTCDDFAWKSLGVLMGWGAEFNKNITDLSRVFINFYAEHPPLRLDTSDPETYAQVAASYAKYALADLGNQCTKLPGELEKEMCAAKLMLSLVEWLETNRYVYINDAYYVMDRFGLESFNWEYHTTPVKPIKLGEEFLRHVPADRRHLFE